MTSQNSRTRRTITCLAALLFLGACVPAETPGLADDTLPSCTGVAPIAGRSFMVFFDRHGADLTPRARRIIAEFVQVYAPYDSMRVTLEASTDTSETKRRDRGLARSRGEAVAIALRKSGIPRDTSIVVTQGKPLVPTPANMPELQNRRVYLIGRGGVQVRPTPSQAECRAWLGTHGCNGSVIGAKAEACAQVREVADSFVPPSP